MPRKEQDSPKTRAPKATALRPLWLGLGFVLLVPGFLGLIVPGLPGTVFFILAAAAFARGDPKWEAWLLGLPVIGELVGDFRAGKGMPLRAKWIASVCIVLAVAFSLSRIPVLVGQVAWVLVGVAGIAYICLWVPTQRPAGVNPEQKPAVRPPPAG